MGNRKHSRIDKFEPELKETVDEMIKSGSTYREIVDYIKSHGISISLSAVGSYAKNLITTVNDLRITQETFRAVMEETERYPDLDTTEGILRIASARLLDAVSRMPETEISSRDMEMLIRNSSALARAVAAKKRADVQNKEIIELGKEQFQTALFDLMAQENPELYKAFRKFIKENQEKLS